MNDRVVIVPSASVVEGLTDDMILTSAFEGASASLALGLRLARGGRGRIRFFLDTLIRSFPLDCGRAWESC